MISNVAASELQCVNWKSIFSSRMSDSMTHFLLEGGEIGIWKGWKKTHWIFMDSLVSCNWKFFKNLGKNWSKGLGWTQQKILFPIESIYFSNFRIRTFFNNFIFLLFSLTFKYLKIKFMKNHKMQCNTLPYFVSQVVSSHGCG